MVTKKTSSNLSVVKQGTKSSEDQLREKNEIERETEKLMLTTDEVKLRVREIRGHLEQFNEMIGGLHFDIIYPDEPPSLRGRDADMESSGLAERLNPVIAGHYKPLQNHLYNNTDDDILADYALGPMKWALADAAFGIGVLAGAIFAGATSQEIDRLERGLVYAVSKRPDVKD